MTITNSIFLILFIPTLAYIICENLGFYSYRTEESARKAKITTIIISLIIVIIWIYFRNKGWNGGFCPQCDSPWKLIDVENTRRGFTKYIYECPKCLDIFIKK